MLEVATRLGLWRPGERFDFAATYSAGEARHRYYSGRRMWRALSLFAPSLGLSPRYEDLLVGTPPPLHFSVVPDKPLTRADFFAIMRDTCAWPCSLALWFPSLRFPSALLDALRD